MYIRIYLYIYSQIIYTHTPAWKSSFFVIPTQGSALPQIQACSTSWERGTVHPQMDHEKSEL